MPLLNAGSAALGNKGKAMVLCFASMEFFGATCTTLVVVYKQIESFLPNYGASPHSMLLSCRHTVEQGPVSPSLLSADAFGLSPLQLAATIGTAVMLPLLFVPSLRHLSHFSSLGVVSTVVVMTAVVASALVDPHRTAAPLQVIYPRVHSPHGVLASFGQSGEWMLLVNPVACLRL